jgi:predicted nucleic acid-binding protein
MKKLSHIFLDANVLIDFLADRKPFSSISSPVFQQAKNGHIKLYCSGLTFSIAYYVLRKFSTKEKLKTALIDLSSIISITQIDESVIHSALTSPFKDFEDAIQYFSALTNPSIEAILTRNKPDFISSSEVDIYTPEEIINLI